MCFACGPDNPVGLHIPFRMDGEHCVGDFTAGPNHVGYEKTVHGGIIYAALDDVMANVLYLQGIKAHTARCEVRYRRPLQVGEPLRLSGWVAARRRRMVTLKGEARLTADGTLVAECDAVFMVV